MIGPCVSIRPIKSCRRTSKTENSAASGISNFDYKKITSKLLLATIPRRTIKLDPYYLYTQPLQDKSLQIAQQPPTLSPTQPEQKNSEASNENVATFRPEQRLSLQELACSVNDEDANILSFPTQWDVGQEQSGNVTEQLVPKIQICRVIIKPSNHPQDDEKTIKRSASRTFRASQQQKFIENSNNIRKLIKNKFFVSVSSFQNNDLLEQYENIHQNMLNATQKIVYPSLKHSTELIQSSPNKKYLQMTVNSNYGSLRGSMDSTKIISGVKKSLKGIAIYSQKRTRDYDRAEKSSSNISCYTSNRGSSIMDRPKKYAIQLQNQQQLDRYRGHCCE